MLAKKSEEKNTKSLLDVSQQFGAGAEQEQSLWALPGRRGSSAGTPWPQGLSPHDPPRLIGLKLTPASEGKFQPPTPNIFIIVNRTEQLGITHTSIENGRLELTRLLKYLPKNFSQGTKKKES